MKNFITSYRDSIMLTMKKIMPCMFVGFINTPKQLCVLCFFCLLGLGCAESDKQNDVVLPKHPREIVFPEYVFDVPLSDDFVERLDNGVLVFVVEDKELPLIQVTATFKGGKYLDPTNQTGLTGMMATLLRSGGTTSVSAEEFDEQVAFLAANMGVSGGGSTVTATLSCLASNFKDSFGLFLDMLQHPLFQESRLRIEKDDAIESMKQRNDFPSNILSREFAAKMYGNSYLGKPPVEESILSIDRYILLNQYNKIISSSNLILSVSGDFVKEEMLQYLNETVGLWVDGSAVSSPPAVDSVFKPGIYFVDQDIPQGAVKIGLRSVQQDDPDVEAISVMNFILGGGGFSSRITQSVRSNEGLAYGAGSRFSAAPWGKGVWVAGFESKSSTVALAAKLVFDEIERIKTEPVSNEDLTLAKNSLIEQFPSRFQSKSGTLGVFVRDEITGRDSEYWNTYRDKIEAVTAEDVMRVANRILIQKNMFIVVVGDWDVIKNGDDGGRATMQDISSLVGGEIVELPLRNPLTLEVSSE